MENTILFLDFANINRSASDNDQVIDYETFLHYVGEGRNLQEAFAYVPIDPHNEHGNDRAIEDLQLAGYVTNSKVGVRRNETFKCDFDVEMTIDIMRMAHIAKPDIITIASGDGDFVPVIRELRKMGIRAEVAAFDQTASRSSILECSGFINLNGLFENDDDEDDEVLYQEDHEEDAWGLGEEETNEVNLPPSMHG